MTWAKKHEQLSIQVSMHHSHPEPSVVHLFVHVYFPEFSPHSQHKALVDSGAAGNFINRAFTHRLGIPTVPVVMPFPVHALDSRPLGSEVIREATIPLGMVTQGVMRRESVSSSLTLLRFPWY